MANDAPQSSAATPSITNVSAQSSSAESTTDDVYLDQVLWTRFSDAGNLDDFAQPWLALLCRMLSAERGVLVLGAPEGDAFAPAAHWPDEQSNSERLSSAAELAIAQRRGVVREGPGISAVAYPVLVDERLHGVVAIEIASPTDAALRAVMRQLQWSSAWLKLVIGQQSLVPRERLAAVLDLVAIALGHERFQAAATSVVNELAAHFKCDRVSVGFQQGGHARVRALSHSAEFGQRSNLASVIGSAMDEAIDQSSIILHRPGASAPVDVTRAHVELANEQGAQAICTVPFSDGSHLVGAITLESGDASHFDDRDTVDLLENVALVVGPLLEAKRREDRWLIYKIADSAKRSASAVFGAGHLGLKLAVISAIALISWLSVATGVYRISADATLEGTVQRAVVAPFSGYVAKANARAGDLVNAGAVIAQLDDRDLTLERLKWLSQREQHVRENRQAAAEYDRAKVMILDAQLARADAQIKLLDVQLQRTHLTAPIDGMIVSGDLSQALDAPVERGDVLFEIAPLNSYRVTLQVDEHDMADIELGQQGQLVLAASPGEFIPIVVERLTPVASAADGKNTFRVEARLADGARSLRPGMQGIAKIDVDERKLIWIWTRRMLDWLTLQRWSLLP